MKHVKSKKGSELLGQILLWALLIGALLVFSVPFFFMISNSFEEFSYVLPYPPRLLPTRLDFSAYKHKRRASALLHSFLLQTAHEHLLAKNSVQGRKIRKSDVIAEQLLRYLNQNYTKRLTSREIEELFEGNFDYLNRVFSTLTGSPVFAYLNILRINNAKQLISTTDLPFSEIAYLVGIEDRYYFSKLFRKMTGMSPTEYYKEVRS